MLYTELATDRGDYLLWLPTLDILPCGAVVPIDNGDHVVANDGGVNVLQG